MRGRHLTHDGEPRGEMQADSLQTQENYLSYQSEQRAMRRSAQGRAELRSINRLAAELMSSLSRLAASKLTAQVVLLIL